MTADDFRNLALELPETTEASHMGHADFRVRGKIFATLPYPDEDCGMVKLTPEQQAEFVRAAPAIFEPFPGGWGARGATLVRLRSAKPNTVRPALVTAWRNTAPKRLAQRFDDE